jgi:hypothetical protein
VAHRLVRLAPNAACTPGLPTVSSHTGVKEPYPTALLSFFCTSTPAAETARSAHARRRLRSAGAEASAERGCQVPPKPTHSVSTLPVSRVFPTKSDESFFARSTHPHGLPGLFHPGNALVLPPSGLYSSRRSRPVSEPHPPLPFRAELSLRLRLRRVEPSEKGRQRTEARSRLALLAFSSLRLSLSPS